MNIRIVDNRADIVRLWQEAFGDTDDDICYFADNVRYGECLGLYDDELCSMMYLVDCSINGVKCRYIYAACTAQNMQGRGYMSHLLTDARRNNDFLCLIPADDALVDFYQARGFDITYDVDDIVFDEDDGIIEYLYEGCSMTTPIVLAYRSDR